MEINFASHLIFSLENKNIYYIKVLFKNVSKLFQLIMKFVKIFWLQILFVQSAKVTVIR